jgi:cytochrome c-type biogenesis protein CcmH
MTLWLILTIMTSAAAVWLSAPLIRRFDRPRGADAAGDIEVYRDQLQEVERELSDGLIDEAQAETARIEIKRRILAADRARSADMPGLSGQERSVALIGATAIVVLGSTILYAVTGSPDLAAVRSPPPAAPLFASGAAAPAQRAPTAMPPQHPPLDSSAAIDVAGGGEAGLPTVEEMTRRLAARLARNPADTEGWRTLGWSYLNVGRFDEAAAAYAKAVERDPGNTEFRDGLVEALVGGANGVVTREARAAIAETLQRDPKDARARYFAGLASEQDGDKATALATWTALMNDAGIGESLAADLKSRLSDLGRDTGAGAGVDGPKIAAAAAGERGPVSAPGGTAAPRAPGNGPNRQDVEAAAAMAPADRTAMIRGMVDGLASRLERSPHDADGWIKLIRSRVVLGEGDLAKQALDRGLAAFADEGAERDRIAAAAQELGVAQ